MLVLDSNDVCFPFGYLVACLVQFDLVVRFGLCCNYSGPALVLVRDLYSRADLDVFLV